MHTGGQNSAINDVLISIYTHVPHGNIDTVLGNITYTASSYLNTVTINVNKHMPSGNINTVTSKINLYDQWLSEYGYNRGRYATPSGNINSL